MRISPSADGAVESAAFPGGIAPVFFIQSMPATRTINAVTLGDIARNSACGYRENLTYQLSVVEIASGQYSDGASTVIAQGQVVAPGDYAMHRFTWVLPETQLVAGRAYEFVIENDDWYGCAGVTWTRWAHNSNVVNAGPGACSQFEATTYYPSYRYWHVQGQSDVNAFCPYGYDLAPFNFDSAMPTGWLEVRRYYPYQPFVYDNTAGTYGAHCPAQGSGSWDEARPYTATGGASQVACEFTGFTPPGQTTSDGWYFSTPWPAGVPRDLFLQLDDQGGAGTGGVTASGTSGGSAAAAAAPQPATTAGGSNPAAPNLRPCAAGDPVDCASGNLYENAADLKVPGRGVPLTFARTYNAMFAGQPAPGPLGAGWTTSFSARLEFQPDVGRVVVHNDNGSTLLFGQNTDGTYSAPAFATASLVKNADSTYSFTLKNQLVSVFDQAGVLQSITDRNGDKTTVSYAAAKVDHVTDPEGRALRFSYDAAGLLASVTDSHGRTVQFTHDAAGNLTGVTDVAGRTTGYAYDSGHLLTVVQDPRGSQTQNTYDAQGRVVSQTDAAGATTTFAYRATGTAQSTTTITDPLGHQTIEQFSSGQLTAKTVAAGTSLEATSTYRYDASHNLASETAPDGSKTSYQYDNAGNLTGKTDPAGATTSYTYTLLNDPKTITDGMGETTTFYYDARGNLTGRTRPLAGTNQVAHLDYAYDPAHPGDLVSASNPDAQTTKYTYDANGDVTSITDPAGDVTTFAYNDIGWLQSTVAARGNAPGANPDDYRTALQRDASGDVTKITDPLGHQTLIGHDANGNRTTVTDALGHVTRTAYDANNRPTTTTRTDGSQIATAYDAAGRVSQITDGLDHTTGYGYDARDELTATTDPLGRTKHYGYDQNERRVSAVNARGQTTNYGYDAAGRVNAITYHNASTPDVTYAYDRDGRRVQTTDGTGTSTWVYDSLGRLTSTTVPSGGALGRVTGPGVSIGAASVTPGTPETTTYTYDLADRLARTDYTNDATVATAFNGAPTVARFYDDAGRLTSIGDWLGQTTTFSYDPDGNLTHIAYPNSTAAAMTYDRAGQQTRTTDTGPGGTFLDIPYGRDATGQVTSTSLTGATASASETLAYDQNQRLTTETAANTPNATLDRNAYTYDNADRTTTLSILGVPLNLAYDNADQLTQTSEPNTQTSTATYTYDADGNRTTQTGPANLTATYSYDQAGQLTRYRNTGQNAANGLLPSTPTQTATDTTYRYSGDGLRADLLWDHTQPLPQILADATNIYIPGPTGTPIEQIAPGGTITYYHADQLGSTRALTDKNGRTLALYDYDPYGNRRTTLGAPLAAFGYAGQYTDPTTGFIYMRARWYDPQTAQFLTRDPLGYASGSQNPYTYAANNPTNLIDPTGLASCNPNRALGNILAQLRLQLEIEAAQATAQAASSGSIVGTEFAIDELDAETGATLAEAAAATRESGVIFRTGSQTDGALTDPGGVSFRDSVSSSADGAQVFRPGSKIYAVDTARLPPGSVVRDGVPAGHVSVLASPQEIRGAIVGAPLDELGLRPLEDGSFGLPK